MTGLWLISYIALWILFLTVAIVLVSVLRHLGTIYESLAQISPASRPPIKLIVGQPLPALTLPTLTGELVSLDSLQGEKAIFFVVSPGCGPCRELLAAIAANSRAVSPFDSAAQQRIILSLGTATATSALIEKLVIDTDIPVLIDSTDTVGAAWGVSGTPTTILVDEQLRVLDYAVGFEQDSLRAAAPVAHA